MLLPAIVLFAWVPRLREERENWCAEKGRLSSRATFLERQLKDKAITDQKVESLKLVRPGDFEPLCI